MPRKQNVGLTTIAGPVTTTGATAWIRLQTPPEKTWQVSLDVKARTGVSATVKVQISDDGVNSAGEILTAALTNAAPSDGTATNVPWGYVRLNVTAFTTGSGGGAAPEIILIMGEA